MNNATPIYSDSTLSSSGCAPLLGFKNLKEHIHITQDQVECPVLGCLEKVKRQRKVFKKEEIFKCPEHHIWISPSTFEYPSETYNILNRSASELELLSTIKQDKRESRIARDNSEDALTWNVFRFLQNSMLLGSWLQKIHKQASATEPEVIYWSVSAKTGKQFELLNRSREAFGEKPKYGSEPDIIVITERQIFFIEAKLTATNVTPGSMLAVAKIMNRPNQYETGGNEWFKSVFKSEYWQIMLDQKYEFMRFWLLGSWMAKEAGKDFFLVNLICENKERSVPREFAQHIRTTESRTWYRETWEGIHRFVKSNGISSDESKAFLDYMENKTIGYDKNGDLKKAFSI